MSRCCINLLKGNSKVTENLPHQGHGHCYGQMFMLTFDYSELCGIVFPKIFEFASEARTVSVRPIRGLRKRHAIPTKINKISDVLSLILDPVFYPCHSILSEQSNKEAVPAMMPKKYED